MSEFIPDKPQPSQNDRINVKDNDQRFGIRPEARLLGIAAGTALFGMFDGFYRGFTNSALVYLAENSHRLPRTVGGWYFYHKRKNYVCIKNGIVSGFKFSTKLTAIGLGYFGLEVFLDEARGQVDFLNTVVTTGVAAFAYAKYKKLSKLQTKSIMKKSLAIGLVSGLVQDLFIYSNEGTLWYLKQLGVPNFSKGYQDKKLL